MKKLRKMNLLSFFIILSVVSLSLFLAYEKSNNLLNSNSVLNNNNFSLSNNNSTVWISLGNPVSNPSSNSNMSANLSVNKSVSSGGGGNGGGGGDSGGSSGGEVIQPTNQEPASNTSNNTSNTPGNNSETSSNYPLHKNISVTLFWVGEEASSENDFIPNLQSAWDDKWKEHYGGIDAPINRGGYLPYGFVPKENPFYFALPYNDFDEHGERKTNSKNIFWYGEKNWGSSDSICKNRWIRIIKGNIVAYAQWEDVGPFEEDDFNYVFGSSLPKSKTNNNAGLDVSPAVHDYLNLQDIDIVSWQFVNFSDVPQGPWKTTVTSSQVYWE